MKSFAIANLDGEPHREFFARVERVAAAGVETNLLRDGLRPDAERLETARRVRELVPPASTFLVHGRLDLALACGADGVHLPATGLPVVRVKGRMPEGRVGRSCHTVEEVRRAAEEGADYVLLGPVFDPRSKPGAGRIGREELARAARLRTEVFALGGISVGNLPELAGLGLAGVAAITMFMVDEPLEAVVEAVRRT